MTPDMMRFGRRVLAAVLIVGLIVAVVYSIQILLLVFAGILLAVLFRSAGTWLSNHTPLSINWCMAIVLVAFGAFLFGSVWMFGVQIVNQADELFWAVSQAYGEFHAKLARYHVAGSMAAGTRGLNLESPVKAAASTVLWMAAAIVMVFFIGVYLSTAPQRYTDLFLSFFQRSVRGRIARLLDAIAAALRWWLTGQLIAVGLVGAYSCYIARFHEE
jgi:predicted PurR-regulated permease PerM